MRVADLLVQRPAGPEGRLTVEDWSTLISREREHLRLRLGDFGVRVMWSGTPTSADCATLIATLQAAWHLDAVAESHALNLRLDLARKRAAELLERLEKIEDQVAKQPTFGVMRAMTGFGPWPDAAEASAAPPVVPEAA